MTQLHQRGLITDAALMLYGISGPLPDAEEYSRLTVAQKNNIWHERMERKLGPDWLSRLQNLSVPLPVVEEVRFTPEPADWLRDGF